MAKPENDPMEAGRHCGAKTRGGATCRRFPLKGKTRCKLHGGASTNQAKAGNTIALKHGLYSDAIRDDEIDLWERIEIGSLDDELKIARLRLRRLLMLQRKIEEKLELSDKDLEIEEIRTFSRTGATGGAESVRRAKDYKSEIRNLLQLIGNLEKTRSTLGGGQGDPSALAREISEALTAIDDLDRPETGDAA